MAQSDGRTILRLGGILLFMCLAIAFVVWMRSTPTFYKFPGLQGPAKPTELKKYAPTSWMAFSKGNKSDLCILLTETNCSWLGLLHGLKTIGIPCSITTNVTEAATHDCIFAYPLVSGRVLSKTDFTNLADFMRGGGTLLAVNVAGGIPDLFGVASAVASQDHSLISVNEASLTRFQLDVRTEQKIHVGHGKGVAVAGTYSYPLAGGKIIAAYENGEAAIVEKSVGKGLACAIGLDLGHYLSVAYNNRVEIKNRAYVNTFEPSIDILLRVVRQYYVERHPAAIVLGTVPYGKSSAIVMSHDIDFTGSLSNTVDYAQVEKSLGVRATFFLQTKYIKDYNDDIFFNSNGIPHIRKLEELNMEIASHSVSHSPTFLDFEMGSGSEQYPRYFPFVVNPQKTKKGTILGELRVSKFLLEHFSTQRVVSFRPGHLSYPERLPEALDAVDYLYSSSVTANSSLTHLPYRLNVSRGYNTESPIYEFPVTIEDEEKPPLLERLDRALQVYRSVTNYGGAMVVLVHTDITGSKLEFVRKFIEETRKEAWYGSLSDLGSWWSARDGVNISSRVDGASLQVSLSTAKPISGLSLSTDSHWNQAKSGNVPLQRSNGGWILPLLQQSMIVEFSHAGE